MSFFDTETLSRQIERVPYARMLGIASCGEPGRFVLPARKSNIGNPTLPALHGGAIAGFMELSAMITVLQGEETKRIPKVIDISIDYLRAGRFVETYSRCKLNYLGRRMLNVSVVAWQESEDLPIATARAQFLVKD